MFLAGLKFALGFVAGLSLLSASSSHLSGDGRVSEGRKKRRA